MNERETYEERRERERREYTEPRGPNRELYEEKLERYRRQWREEFDREVTHG